MYGEGNRTKSQMLAGCNISCTSHVKLYLCVPCYSVLRAAIARFLRFEVETPPTLPPPHVTAGVELDAWQWTASETCTPVQPDVLFQGYKKLQHQLGTYTDAQLN